MFEGGILEETIALVANGCQRCRETHNSMNGIFEWRLPCALLPIAFPLLATRCTIEPSIIIGFPSHGGLLLNVDKINNYLPNLIIIYGRHG